MREIGGYFELEKFRNNEYYKDLVALNCARNALNYLFKTKNIQKIYLPAFLCSSVKLMCQNNSYSYEFYHIDKKFKPVFDKKLKDNEYIYIVNYYGLFSEKEIVCYKKKYKNIIFDNVHAFYQKPIKNIDTIYSCRKFFGVPDGAYLSTDCILELDKDKSSARFKHLLGRFEGLASDYYLDFKQNDEDFKHSPLRLMSDLTRNILGAIDYENVANKRKENFKILNDAFKNINKINTETIDVPYAYPLYLKNGMEIKKSLTKSGIYVATLWPDAIQEGNELEKDFAENILPLPIDQRYDEDDMLYLIGVLKNYV